MHASKESIQLRLTHVILSHSNVVIRDRSGHISALFAHLGAGLVQFWSLPGSWCEKW